jgi:hypothetical protein
VPSPSDTVVGTFVEPRGMIRSVVAAAAGREVLGLVGAVAASSIAASSQPDASPLAKGQIAYLAVFADQVILFRAKRGALKPKATDEVIASAARSELRTAAVDKGRIAGVLTLTFADGSTWAFDVPKVHLSGADRVATDLR